MSSRASLAVPPDPKRPRLLDPGDQAPSTPATASAAPNGLACASHTGRDPAPTRAVPDVERGEWQSSAPEEKADDDECSRP